jgi:phage terminase large subunit
MDDAEKTTAEKIWERSKADPVWWVKEFLGVTLWQKQCDIAESVRDNKRTSVRSCHGAGKTFDAAMLVLWFLLCHPGARVITTAPTFRQVEKVLWQEIRKAHKAAKIPLGGDMTLTQFKIDDGWFAFGFSTDDPDSMQGQHAKSHPCRARRGVRRQATHLPRRRRIANIIQRALPGDWQPDRPAR